MIKNKNSQYWKLNKKKNNILKFIKIYLNKAIQINFLIKLGYLFAIKSCNS